MFGGVGRWTIAALPLVVRPLANGGRVVVAVAVDDRSSAGAVTWPSRRLGSFAAGLSSRALESGREAVCEPVGEPGSDLAGAGCSEGPEADEPVDADEPVEAEEPVAGASPVRVCGTSRPGATAACCETGSRSPGLPPINQNKPKAKQAITAIATAARVRFRLSCLSTPNPLAVVAIRPETDIAISRAKPPTGRDYSSSGF